MFNLTAHELRELSYYDAGLLLRVALDRLRVRLKFMHLVITIISLLTFVMQKADK